MQEKIKVQSIINSTIEKVWDFYNKPEHIMKWNNASADWHTTKAENDLKAGGKFMYRMEARDGSEGFDFEGTYDEVVEYSSISYTMTDARKVSIKMIYEGAKTKIEVLFDPETENTHELQRAGWQAILDNFKQYVESH